MKKKKNEETNKPVRLKKKLNLTLISKYSFTEVRPKVQVLQSQTDIYSQSDRHTYKTDIYSQSDIYIFTVDSHIRHTYIHSL